MTPEQRELVDSFLTRAADNAATVALEDIAHCGFALTVWALSRSEFPADTRDVLLALFPAQLPERVASMLEESGHQVEFGSLQ